MNLLQGAFNPIGAAPFYLCLGAIPHYIKIWGLEGATPDVIEWAPSFQRDVLTIEGIMYPTGLGAIADFAWGEGIRPYYGGEEMTTSNQTSVAYGAGVFVWRDDKDYREYTNPAAGIIGDASTETIITWTLGSAANRTGNFNGDVVGGFIAPGSMIRIQETASPRRVYDVGILALTAGQGSDTNEVTLSYPVPNGEVRYIGGYSDYIPIPIGKISTPGMRINLATTPFVNDELCAFMAFMPGG